MIEHQGSAISFPQDPWQGIEQLAVILLQLPEMHLTAMALDPNTRQLNDLLNQLPVF
ncbi:MAG: hypothetical protein SNJ68_08000 [Cyanobacteriota bacterium]